MLLCVSFSHNTCDIGVLDKIKQLTQNVYISIRQKKEFFNGCVLLSTCNRYELYLDSKTDNLKKQDILISAALKAITDDKNYNFFLNNCKIYLAGDVPPHLFSVASGLKSVIIGEEEISGQVSESLKVAERYCTSTKNLHKLFQNALNISKKIKNNTSINQSGRSIASLAFELASTRVSKWGQLKALLIGTGQYAKISVKHLRLLGVQNIAVYSPSERQWEFAAKKDLTPISKEDFYKDLCLYDIIISSTNAKEIVFGAKDLINSKKIHRPDKMHISTPIASQSLIIDFCLPHSINKDVDSLKNVDFLDLQTIALHAPLEEINAYKDAYALIENESLNFANQVELGEIGPVLQELKNYFYKQLETEINRLPDNAQKTATIKAMRHLTGVLLHKPMSQALIYAKNGENDKFEKAIETLYNLKIQKQEEEICDLCPVKKTLKI